LPAPSRPSAAIRSGRGAIRRRAIERDDPTHGPISAGSS
jgi:hypothetical protein